MDKEIFERLLQKQVEGKRSATEEIQLQQAYDQLFSEEIAAGVDDPTLGPDEAKELVIRQKIYARILTGDDLLTGNATITDVLDESARELFGESNRWMDLKRTGTLLTRAAQYNTFCAHHHAAAINSTYLLRPIPVTEIMRSSTLTQNPGFPGK